MEWRGSKRFNKERWLAINNSIKKEFTESVTGIEMKVVKSTIDVNNNKWTIKDYDEVVATLRSNARVMRMPAMANYAKTRGYISCIKGILIIDILKKTYR